MAAENHLLSLLDASALALLKPHVRTISVEHGELLHGSASEVEFAYFPRSCIIFFLASTGQGVTAETSVVGMIGSAHDDQSGRALAAKCRSHPDRPGPHFHRRRQGAARRLLRLLRAH